MVCIYCGGKTQVINSRHTKKANEVWRRRSCLACKAVYTSRESVDTQQALRVDKNKHFEPFSRDILLLSIHDSLRHRKTATTDATALTDTVLTQLYPRITQASLSTQDIKTITLATLSRFDKVAATHYNAFHPID